MKEYQQIQQQIIDYIFEVIGSQCTFRDIGEGSGLHNSTVYRLYSGETRYPRFQTVSRLARYAGLELTLTKRGKVQLRDAA